jgi:hypothetical protein
VHPPFRAGARSQSRFRFRVPKIALSRAPALRESDSLVGGLAGRASARARGNYPDRAQLSCKGLVSASGSDWLLALFSLHHQRHKRQTRLTHFPSHLPTAHSGEDERGGLKPGIAVPCRNPCPQWRRSRIQSSARYCQFPSNPRHHQNFILSEPSSRTNPGPPGENTTLPSG